jgi:type IV fimbrial biogenesis protein FimT
MAFTRTHRAARSTGAHRSRERGMTLIELIAAVAVCAIIGALGLPSLRGLVSGTHATVVVNRLLADMSLARSEAIMRGRTGVVCPSTDGSTCSGNDDWSIGWIVFVDGDHDNQRSESEPLLSAVSTSDIGDLRVVSSVDRTKVRFLPDGRNGGTNLSIRVCDGPKVARQVIINVSGRARIERDDTGKATCP